jgi:hypothetical protein
MTRAAKEWVVVDVAPIFTGGHSAETSNGPKKGGLREIVPLWFAKIQNRREDWFALDGR